MNVFEEREPYFLAKYYVFSRVISLDVCNSTERKEESELKKYVTINDSSHPLFILREREVVLQQRIIHCASGIRADFRESGEKSKNK